MATSIVQQICDGCGTRRQRGHCQYPSNPDFNAAHPVKRDALSELPSVVRRRNRARAIRAQNAR